MIIHCAIDATAVRLDTSRLPPMTTGEWWRPRQASVAQDEAIPLRPERTFLILSCLSVLWGDKTALR
jgi:hypothetical protein